MSSGEARERRRQAQVLDRFLAAHPDVPRETAEAIYERVLSRTQPPPVALAADHIRPRLRPKMGRPAPGMGFAARLGLILACAGIAIGALAVLSLILRLR